MESRILSEQFAPVRVAAAFGASGWRKSSWPYAKAEQYEGKVLIGEEQVALHVWFDGSESLFFEIGAGEWSTQVHYWPGSSLREWTAMGDTPDFNDHMAHSLFRLGFEDEALFAQLPDLSLHDKLELRLSFAREFWPPKWLEEGDAKS